MNDDTRGTRFYPTVDPQMIAELRAEVDRWRAEAEWVREQWHRDTAILRERVSVLEAELRTAKEGRDAP